MKKAIKMFLLLGFLCLLMVFTVACSAASDVTSETDAESVVSSIETTEKTYELVYPEEFEFVTESVLGEGDSASTDFFAEWKTTDYQDPEKNSFSVVAGDAVCVFDSYYLTRKTPYYSFNFDIYFKGNQILYVNSETGKAIYYATGSDLEKDFEPLFSKNTPESEYVAYADKILVAALEGDRSKLAGLERLVTKGKFFSDESTESYTIKYKQKLNGIDCQTSYSVVLAENGRVRAVSIMHEPERYRQFEGITVDVAELRSRGQTACTVGAGSYRNYEMTGWEYQWVIVNDTLYLQSIGNFTYDTEPDEEGRVFRTTGKNCYTTKVATIKVLDGDNSLTE